MSLADPNTVTLVPCGTVAPSPGEATATVGPAVSLLADAAASAVSRVAATTRELDWFEVSQIRGHIEDGQVAHIQVGLKVGFRIEDTGAG